MASLLGAGRFSEEFVDKRRLDLELYLNSLVIYDCFADSPVLARFLDDQDMVLLPKAHG